MPKNELFSYRIILRYIPLLAWILLMGSLTLHVMFPVAKGLWDSVINLTLIFIFAKVTTVIHEVGHLTAAHWAGGVLKRIILGIGHEIYRSEVGVIRVILKSIPMGGAAMAIFPNNKQERWRYILYVMGGVLFNFLVAASLILLFGYDSSFLIGVNGIDVSSALIFTNTIAVLNLIPFYTSAPGMKTPTDGMASIKMLFAPGAQRNEYKHMELFYEAYELMEARSFDEAEQIYNLLYQSQPTQPLVIFNMSAVCLKKANGQGAINWLDRLESRIQERSVKPLKGLVYNNLAWAYLLTQDVEKAYHYAKMAIEDLTRAPHVQGTYAATLVEGGKENKGIEWLLLNMDFKHPNATTLSSSMYLTLAFHKLDNMKDLEIHRTYVAANLDKLDADDLLLWNHILSRIN